jgi:hypothetical protein
METEGSIPCSQEPSTDSYPEPDQFRPYHPILSKAHFNIIHPPILLAVSFLMAFQPKSYMYSSLPPFVLHALPIVSSLT